MTKVVDIIAVVPRNRNLEGVLKLEVNGKLARQMRVLARGSKGIGDTQFAEMGNTPTGIYSGSQFIISSAFDAKSYGPWGKVKLFPISGNALLAQDIFKRKELLIHSGDLSLNKPWKGNLNPTNGCLRVLNDDMKFLLDFLRSERQQALVSSPDLRCENSIFRDTPIKVQVTVIN